MTRQHPRLCAVVASLAVGLTMPLSAQIALPDVRLAGPMASANPGTPIDHDTPTRGQFRVDRFRVELAQEHTQPDSLVVDTIRQRVVEYATSQLAAFSNVMGFQRFPYSHLAFAADRDSLARAQIAAWLATPQLSVRDRAATLQAVVQMTTDPAYPTRLRDAERALTQMHALPPEFVGLQLEAHNLLARAYYAIGLRDSVIAHGEHALQLLAQQPYLTRLTVLVHDEQFPLQPLVLAAAGLPDGSARVARYLDRIWAMSAWTPAIQLTVSERDQPGVRVAVSIVERLVTRFRQVGQLAVPIQAHVWFNMDTASAHWQPIPRTLPMGDGTIRVLEFGDYGCGPCKEALPLLARLRAMYQARGVEFLYLDQTRGYWGVDLVTPAQEVAKLREFYLDRLHVTIPVGVWAADKVLAGDEGGMLPSASPNRAAYHAEHNPSFVVVDGGGRIRFLRTGFEADGAALEREVQHVLDFLLTNPATLTSPAAIPVLTASPALVKS